LDKATPRPQPGGYLLTAEARRTVTAVIPLPTPRSGASAPKEAVAGRVRLAGGRAVLVPPRAEGFASVGLVLVVAAAVVGSRWYGGGPAATLWGRPHPGGKRRTAEAEARRLLASITRVSVERPSGVQRACRGEDCRRRISLGSASCLVPIFFPMSCSYFFPQLLKFKVRTSSEGDISAESHAISTFSFYINKS
jgi:hypothetical protein